MSDVRRPYLTLTDGEDLHGAVLAVLDEGPIHLVQNGVPLHEISLDDLTTSGSEITWKLMRVDATDAEAATWPEV